MPRAGEIQAIIEEAVAEVFEAALPNLRAEIVRRAVSELEFLAPAPGNAPTDLLNTALTVIQESGSQAEILRRLLEGAARFAGRAALFVVKGGSVSGWQGTGFEDNDAIKSFTLSISSGLIGRAIQGRSPAGGSAAEFDAGFVSAVKSPAGGTCQVLPLVVKEKVAAIIYADPGLAQSGTLDSSALATLTRFTALWLELSALRKTSPAAVAEEPATPAPKEKKSAPAVPAAKGDDADIHKKAKRFAKLLVDEIKLYNQSKVAEGKQNRDLYDRLKEDIEKSRATYEKRFAETPASTADYFTQELIKVLADDDASLMGASFRDS
ncbi:MAG TPA: hypothetical protein VEW69_12100 [Alphaproteobacteria bacterium]|nr:hypothetical protein [Alphaproteobacteria bacterium]